MQLLSNSSSTICNNDMGPLVGSKSAPKQMLTETRDTGIQCQLPGFTIEDIKCDNDKVKFHAGLVHFEMFMLFFYTVCKAASKMNYWRGKSFLAEKKYQRNNTEKPGPKRELRLTDEFFLVMVKSEIRSSRTGLG